MPENKTLHRSLKTAKSLVSSALGLASSLNDPSGWSSRIRQQKPNSYSIEFGMVTRSGVAGYDCSVKIGEYDVPCSILVRQSTNGFGVSEGNIPIEGSTVLVYHKNGDYSSGIILGVVPMSRKATTPEGVIDPVMFQNYPEEATNSYQDNAAYSVPYSGTEGAMSSRLWSNSERYADILPGESFITNENRCGIVTTMYDVELTGGSSFVRISRIDDEIRVRSTNFTKWTSHQAASEFNDGGLISAEGREYSYQGEYLGFEGRSGQGFSTPEETEDHEPRPRTRWWRGFLGNLFSWFAIRPRHTTKESDFDVGLASVHVSQAGGIMARSAGGISIERYDQIPVPHRVKAEWDPEGDKEAETQHDALSGFNLGDDPHSVGLLKSSQMAYAQKTAYQRFDELKKDFKTQQESETDSPGNSDDDPFFSHEVRFDEYKGRKAGLFIGEDGSVIIRDAWGSEIVMEGGDVYINTPGNVVHTANRNVVSLAGNMVVSRGAFGAEITSENSVRVQASKNVQIAGGSDSTAGGVLIESLSDKDSFGFQAGEKAGDSAGFYGVVIKGDKSGVSISGKHVRETALETMVLTTGDNGDTRDGFIAIDSGTVVTTAKDAILDVVETSGCLVSKSGAFLLSDDGSAIVYGGGGAAIINNDLVPAIWVSIEKPDPTQLKEIWDQLQNSDAATPSDWQNLVTNALFSFRTSGECRVESGLQPWNPPGEFRLYEPYWQVMKDLKSPFVSSKPNNLEWSEVHGSKAWPGTDAIDSGKFVTVSTGDLNVEGKYASSKSRGDLSMSISVKNRPMSDFTI